MQLKTWLLIVRILNCLSAAMLIGFQIWFLVALFKNNGVFGVLLQIWAPIFIILLAFLILSAEFKYEKIVENFKFLLWLPGLAIFNLLYFFITQASIVLASIFAGVAVSFLIVNCFKPTGTRGLLTEEWAMVA